VPNFLIVLSLAGLPCLAGFDFGHSPTAVGAPVRCWHPCEKSPTEWHHPEQYHIRFLRQRNSDSILHDRTVSAVVGGGGYDWWISHISSDPTMRFRECTASARIESEVSQTQIACVWFSDFSAGCCCLSSTRRMASRFISTATPQTRTLFTSLTQRITSSEP
jgi:hypothetical protein